MDDRTITCYNASGQERFTAYEAADVDPIHALLLRRIPVQARVLDVGCGSGRDAAFLLRQGFEVTGLDASTTMVDGAKALHPELAERLIHGALPLGEGHGLLRQRFEAILCNAMIMHIPDSDLFDVAFQLSSLLNPGGLLFLSVSVQRPGLQADHRDAEGRLFLERSPSEIRLLFERLGFSLVESLACNDGMARSIDWHILVLERVPDSGARPLDTVERILNRDNKVATYKLALFRALAEIASTEYVQASWHPDGSVRVPTQAIAERWLEYYWPLVASEKHVPQTTGRPMAFRGLLEDLAGEYREVGGLSAFVAAQRNDQLPQSIRALHESCMSKLKDTIWNQPVRHAGGGEHFSVLGYDRSCRAVIIPGDLWRELALAGPWIRDAAILRWGELTERIARRCKTPVRCAEVLELLLAAPAGDRSVADARSVYANLPGKHCVWSGRPIDDTFVIDHVIPFSLWHNSELWNLLPADPGTNGKKSDLLPTSEILRRRKDRIIGYWTAMRNSSMQRRFEVEGARLCGIEEKHFHGNWETPLFSALTRSIELTACQRGIPRWPREASSTKRPSRHPRRSAPARETPPGPRILTPTDVAGMQPNQILPYVGDLAAGPGRDGFRVHELASAEDWIEVEAGMARAERYVIQVNGNSMEPALRPGDFVVVEWHRSPRRQGQVVVMRNTQSTDGPVEAAIKRLHETPSHWLFCSDNPAFDTIRVSRIDIPSYPILGIVIHNLTRGERVS